MSDPDLDALIRLGAVYAADEPAEAANLARLADGLPADRTAARRSVAADFTAGHVVVVDGWVLARTEARLALMAWSTRRPPWPTATRRRPAPNGPGTGS